MDMNDILDFSFASDSEIAATLGARLKAARLAQGLRQADLATRSGVSLATIKTLENHGNCTFQTFIQVVRALRLETQLQDIFKPAPPQSIAAMQARAQGQRQRAPRKGTP